MKIVKGFCYCTICGGGDKDQTLSEVMEVDSCIVGVGN